MTAMEIKVVYYFFQILIRPGPDSLIALFFKKSVLEDDVINGVDLLEQALKAFNSTIIAVFPKDP